MLCLGWDQWPSSPHFGERGVRQGRKERTAGRRRRKRRRPWLWFSMGRLLGQGSTLVSRRAGLKQTLSGLETRRCSGWPPGAGALQCLLRGYGVSRCQGHCLNKGVLPA